MQSLHRDSVLSSFLCHLADRREVASVAIGAPQGRSLRQSTPTVSISLATLLLAWHIAADTVSFLHYTTHQFSLLAFQDSCEQPSSPGC